MTLNHGEKPIAAAVRDQAIAWFTQACGQEDANCTARQLREEADIHYC